MTGSTRLLMLVGFLSLGAAGASWVPQQPQQSPVFRTSVDLVRVDVAVQRGARPVNGLSATDFEIIDNGARQTIESLLTETVPLEAWLVLDVSSSLRGKRLAQLQDAASSFAGALRPQDYAGLVSFSHEVLVPQPLTHDLVAVQTAVARLPAGGATALYDATYIAVQLRNPGAARGVAVVLTDGADNASWLTAQRVLDAAQRSDLVIYGVGVNEATVVSGITGEPFRLLALGAAPAAFADQPQYRFLRDLAAVSGGRVFDASFATLRNTFARVLNDIRARYLLTYYPSNPRPGWHTVDVRLTRSRGEVTARRGYWVTAPPRDPK